MTAIAPPEAPSVLALDDLRVVYRVRGIDRIVLRGVSLEIARGESYGLVGESGCGKSTAAFAAMRYLPRNGRVVGGRITLNGQDLLEMGQADVRKLRATTVSMVYQHPVSALNPSIHVGEQVAEVFRIDGETPRQAREHAAEMLRRVQISDPGRVMDRYPHQLSGGMAQRVVIAMALASNPALLILDEPTTGLDATVEAEVLDLVAALRAEFGTSVLFISHNLAVIARMCERVGVLYAGRLVEEGRAAAVFEDPRHPYTVGLLRCIPRGGVRKDRNRLDTIPGFLPSLGSVIPACVFADRCGLAQEICHVQEPPLYELPPEAIRGSAGGGGALLSGVASDPSVEPGGFGGSASGGGVPLGDVASDPSVEPRAFPSRAEASRAHDATDFAIKARTSRCHFWEIAHTLPRATPRQPNEVAEVETTGPPIVRIENVNKTFRQDGHAFQALHDIDLLIRPGETLGLVGESGSGKTTLARVLLGLTPPDADSILELDGERLPPNLIQRDTEKVRALQIVFQNPDSALNRRWSVKRIIGRALTKLVHLRGSSKDSRLQRLAQAVRFDERLLQARPAQLSGGLKQRVAIARAFAGDPRVVVCDEPTSALDVSVQAAILNLLADLQAHEGVTYLFISHDLGVVRYLSDRIAVLYLGRVQELGTAEEVFNAPHHPYTEALLSAVPTIEGGARMRIRLEGEIPSAVDPPSGCVFHTRCPRFLGEICVKEEPPFAEREPGHFIRCHIPIDELRQLQVVATTPAQG